MDELRNNLIALAAGQQYRTYVLDIGDPADFVQLLPSNPARLAVVFWSRSGATVRVVPALGEDPVEFWRPSLDQNFLVFTASVLPGLISLPWFVANDKANPVYAAEVFP